MSHSCVLKDHPRTWKVLEMPAAVNGTSKAFHEWQFPAAEVSETKFMSLDVNCCTSDEKKDDMDMGGTEHQASTFS